MADAGKPSVYIAMPVYQDVTPGAVDSLFRLQTALIKRGIGCELGIVTGQLLPYARNICVRQFLAGEKTHFLTLDADIAVNAADVIAMIDADLDVLGLVCPKRDIDWELVGMFARQPGARDVNLPLRGTPYCFRSLPGQAPIDGIRAIQTSTGGVIEVECVGTGCLLIDREVFCDIAQSGLAPVVQFPLGREGKPTPLAMFFEFGTNATTGAWEGEDYTFAKKWRSTGGRVYVRPGATVIHEGRHAFVGNLAVALNVAVPP
jgi:hypothetical protein